MGWALGVVVHKSHGKGCQHGKQAMQSTFLSDTNIASLRTCHGGPTHVHLKVKAQEEVAEHLFTEHKFGKKVVPHFLHRRRHVLMGVGWESC